jgi:hypothetical protein
MGYAPAGLELVAAVDNDGAPLSTAAVSAYWNPL